MYILWIDTETGGVNPARNPLLTMAGWIENKGQVIEKFEWKIKPCENDTIEKKALEVNKLTIEEIMNFEDSKTVYDDFISMLDIYVNKYDKKDKMVFAGYNAQFDKNFLYHWFKKHGNKFFFSYFYGLPMDVGSFVLNYCAKFDLKLANHKLATVAKHFGISAEFHDAMEDIIVTRKIFNRVQGDM